MLYRTEREMYSPVQKWLSRFLTTRFKDSTVRVFDASTTKLAALIERQALQQGLSPDWPTWEIQIDVVGFVHQPSVTHLAFVECKNIPLTLDHLAQLLGYARIARPGYAFLISPQGPKRSLLQLLKTHQRLDVLEFAHDKGKLARAIVVARWDTRADSIALDSVISTGAQKTELSKFL